MKFLKAMESNLTTRLWRWLSVLPSGRYSGVGKISKRSSSWASGYFMCFSVSPVNGLVCFSFFYTLSYHVKRSNRHGHAEGLAVIYVGTWVQMKSISYLGRTDVQTKWPLKRFAPEYKLTRNTSFSMSFGSLRLSMYSLNPSIYGLFF